MSSNQVSPRAAHHKPHTAPAALADLTRAIIPNRQYMEDGLLYEQTASVAFNGRNEVYHLEQQLEQALDHLQVRGKPICQDREQLFSESFDELIRQISLEQPERGLFLLRISKYRVDGGGGCIGVSVL
jgi:dynein light intermediate chain